MIRVASNISDLIKLFFKELKQYNSSNFKTLLNADMQVDSAVLYKSCSSVVTRYFIFKEKHPEISETDMRILYYKLRIDMIARYFSEYPAASYEDLIPFQLELKRYVQNTNEGADADE